MTILIDLGTSRTGVAFLGENQEWLSFPSPMVPPMIRAGGASWGVMADLIKGVTNLTFVGHPKPHLLSFSRYVQVGDAAEDFAVPFSSAAKNVPGGVRVVPDIGDGVRFTSIKQDERLANVFLEALHRLVLAYGGGGAQWVIGSSTGGIDPRRGLPVGTDCFNEAVAVVFALASLDIGNLRNNHNNKFLLLADLGGGFLDISVAHDLKFEEEAGEARIVNYGGYPLGVDRIALRFSTDPVQSPNQLIDLIGLAICYHLLDYGRREGAKGEGIIVLTGGGFSRLDVQLVERRLKAKLRSFGQHLGVYSSTGLYFAGVDTKYLTLFGLARMEALGKSGRGWDEGAGGENISKRDPAYYGQELTPAGVSDTTWYAMVDSLRAAAY